MKIFLVLKSLIANRLLKLKMYEEDDKYVSMVNGILSLNQYSQSNTTSQRVVIHNRKLYFSLNGNLFNLSLDNDNIKIKLKPEKKIAYLKRPKSIKPKDLFGFEKPKKQNSIRHNLVPKKITKKLNVEHEVQENTPINDKKQVEIEKDDSIEKIPNIDMTVILNKVKSLLNEKKNYLIESDSKIEEEIIKYKKVEVLIHPIDSKYIKLKTPEKDCITFINNMFVFTPCLNVDSQIFKLVREEDIKEKLKVNKVKEDKLKYKSNDEFIDKKLNLYENTTRNKYTSNFISNYKKPSTIRHLNNDLDKIKLDSNLNNKFNLDNNLNNNFNLDDNVLIDTPYIENSYKEDTPLKYENIKNNTNEKHKNIMKQYKNPYIQGYHKKENINIQENHLTNRKNTVKENFSIFDKSTSKIIKNPIQKESQMEKPFSPDDILQKLKLDINDTTLENLLS